MHRSAVWWGNVFGVGLLFAIGVVAGWSSATEQLAIPKELEVLEQQRIDAIARASRPTLAVFAADKAGGGGSGVVISSDGYALTNFHVVQPCGIHMKCGMNDGRLYDAVVVGIDPTGDLALIKLLGRDDFPTAVIGDSDAVRVGDPCFAVGNPFLLATDLTPTVTYGVVSGVKRYQPPAAGAILEYTDCIQTDAAINPGNSGGPLFNGDGELIGINGRGSFEKRGRVNVGVGYAISIQQAMNFLGVLESGRVVDHATLGATASTDDDSRVVVTNILESSDAYRRGLRYGDEIVSLAGRPIDSANTLKNVLGILPQGWRVPMTYRRDNQEITTHVRLAGVHSKEVLLALISAGEERPSRGPRPGPDRPRDDDDPEPEGEEQQPADEDKEAEKSSDESGTAEDGKVPVAIRDVYQERREFANYHFNLLHRQRLWDAVQASTGSFTTREPWLLTGKVAPTGSFRISLRDQAVFARWSSETIEEELLLDLSANVDLQRQPSGSGGLYLALHLFRRFLVDGPERFGEVFYWGTAPLPGREKLCDVLVGIYDAVEVRFYFDTETKQMVCLEMFPDTEVDPCELHFEQFDEFQGHRMPRRIEVRQGDDVFATMEVESYEFTSQTTEGE